MAQITEILTIEQDRTDSSRGVVHLFQEGSFYRAYEWSAWLCSRFIRDFKVTNKNLKNIETPVCFVGFPITSLDKYTPSGSDVVSNGDKELDVLLPESVIPADMTIDVMAADYESWKLSLPVAESGSKKKEDSQTADLQSRGDRKSGKPQSMTMIMQQILSFPIENKTPMQCMSFLAEVKQQLVELI